MSVSYDDLKALLKANDPCTKALVCDEELTLNKIKNLIKNIPENTQLKDLTLKIGGIDSWTVAKLSELLHTYPNIAFSVNLTVFASADASELNRLVMHSSNLKNINFSELEGKQPRGLNSFSKALKLNPIVTVNGIEDVIVKRYSGQNQEYAELRQSDEQAKQLEYATKISQDLIDLLAKGYRIDPAKPTVLEQEIQRMRGYYNSKKPGYMGSFIWSAPQNPFEKLDKLLEENPAFKIEPAQTMRMG